MINKTLHKAIHTSQHVQRNWDLNAVIPQQDLETIATAATCCPSKQNVVFYKPYFITNRSIIEAIHKNTTGFFIPHREGVPGSGGMSTNTQTLANLLIVLTEYYDEAQNKNKSDITQQKEAFSHPYELQKDAQISVGVAAGYINLTSALLGYRTGCCTCFDGAAIQQILGSEGKPMLLMGVGVPDVTRPRREHHQDARKVFPTKSKNIDVIYLD